MHKPDSRVNHACLACTTAVNGEPRQDARGGEMILDFRDLTAKALADTEAHKLAALIRDDTRHAAAIIRTLRSMFSSGKGEFERMDLATLVPVAESLASALL